jgi:hypothetical protein
VTGFFERIRARFSKKAPEILQQPALSSDGLDFTTGVCASYYREQREYFIRKKEHMTSDTWKSGYLSSEPCDSFMLTRYNIEPGQVVKISSRDFDDQWCGGPQFAPQHCIYVGTSDLWLLQQSQVISDFRVVFADTPLDTYRPSAPTFVNWPIFNCSAHSLELMVENRGKEIGHFVARLAGSFRA